jgi:tRNA (cytidine/uridine-2'-O-)-methyltransferase
LAEPPLHIALYHPEIPPNTGNVGRLCVGLGLRLHLVHPLGFSIDEKAVRRAGLDYWKHVDLQEHADEAAFWAWAEGRRLWALSARAQRSFTSCRYQRGDVLLLGRESVGLPDEVLARTEGLRIPIAGPIRSLNLANAATVVAYEAARQVMPELFAG